MSREWQRFPNSKQKGRAPDHRYLPGVAGQLKSKINVKEVQLQTDHEDDGQPRPIIDRKKEAKYERTLGGE
jgi:hypothetical protein